MNTEKEKQEAIENNLNSIKSMMQAYTAQDPEAEGGADEFRNNILSIDTTEVYDICTGTAGPANGFRVYVRVYENGEKEVSHATAYFNNWGTATEETTLTEKEADALLSMVYIEGVSE